ncbi:MAG TPA: hypothetical protein VJ931_09125 [Actinomycetota bacterium]|nr:hypothetical protein [Actinomycetota bacterium]
MTTAATPPTPPPEEIGAPHLTVDQVAAGELKTFEGTGGVAWADVEQCVDHATACPIGPGPGRVLIGRPARCVDCREQQLVAELEVIHEIEAQGGPVGDERDRRAAEPPGLKHGDTVHHAKHGVGQVITVENFGGTDSSVEVNFSGHCRWVHIDNLELDDRGAAEPPVDELYNRIRRLLLQEANVLPQALPSNAQAAITCMALRGDETVVDGFALIIDEVANRAYEKGWMANQMFGARLLEAATTPAVGAERLTVVEGEAS